MIFPERDDIIQLVRDVAKFIEDDFRVTDDADDDQPGIQLTVGHDPESGRWSYQTGDNSFTGGAYGFPNWAVVGVYRDSDAGEVADDILDQLEELNQH